VTRLLFAGTARCQIALNPSLARQLADEGFDRNSLAEWLYRNTCTKWEELNETEKKFTRGAVGIMPGHKSEDCEPGLVLPAFAGPSSLAILVAGDAGGNTVIWNSPVGSTSVHPDMMNDPQSIPKPSFMTKVVRGAALTRAGR
jgi:hypothetical protein